MLDRSYFPGIREPWSHPLDCRPDLNPSPNPWFVALGGFTAGPLCARLSRNPGPRTWTCRLLL